MKKNNLFYTYYDAVFASKDYADECRFFIKTAKKNYTGNIGKVLEIGTGTGNHTLELAKQNCKIVSIDTDRKMLDIAVKKLTNNKQKSVILFHTPVELLKEKDFNLAVAGFNVVNYLLDFASLIRFFNGVSKRLAAGGIFIFDCWNGIAAIKNPPETKTTEVLAGNKMITCRLSTVTNLMEQKTKLTYDITVSDLKKKTVEKEVFSFYHTLWTPMELNYCIEQNGLEIIKRCRAFHTMHPATENNWKMMYVCRKQ